MKKIVIEFKDGIYFEAEGYKDKKCIEALNEIQKLIGGKTIWKRSKLMNGKSMVKTKSG